MSLISPQPPPAYYTLYPRSLDTTYADQANRPAPAPAPSPTPSKPKSETLIERYHLEERVTLSSGVSVRTPEEAAGRAVWEDSAEKREASLRERKAQMILAARQYVPFFVSSAQTESFSLCQAATRPAGEGRRGWTVIVIVMILGDWTCGASHKGSLEAELSSSAQPRPPYLCCAFKLYIHHDLWN